MDKLLPCREAFEKWKQETKKNHFLNILYEGWEAGWKASSRTPQAPDELLEALENARASMNRIANDYLDSEDIGDDYAEEHGLDADEALAMAYDNVKWEAKRALERLEQALSKYQKPKDKE